LDVIPIRAEVEWGFSDSLKEFFAYFPKFNYNYIIKIINSRQERIAKQ